MIKKTKKQVGKVKKVYEKPDILSFTAAQSQRIVKIYIAAVEADGSDYVPEPQEGQLELVLALE